MATGEVLSHYKAILIVLATAGLVVPVMHRLRLSPVIGYLAAGAILGPYGLGRLTGEAEWLRAVTFDSPGEIAAVAELGVVFLLFVIGLELSAERLMTMRRLVFGMGTTQVVVSAVAIGLTAPFFGNDLTASVLIGLALALSSTAMVLQWLSERHRMSTSVGRASLAVLLLQDLAVVPILFLVGILGAKDQSSIGTGLMLALGEAALTLVVIVVLGRLLLRPLFRLAAGAGGPELFMAATLLVAVGAGAMTAAAGLSMALGGFVAGLLLAETEYRKAVEATIEPFKGLLLGVFFISVGTRVDAVGILRDPLYVVVCAVGLVGIKVAIAVAVARAFGYATVVALEIGLLLGPCGEFAFIIIGLAREVQLIDPGVTGILLAVVAVTMAAIPVLGVLGERLARRLAPQTRVPEVLLDSPPGDGAPRAIVVGAGRVGRLVSEMLHAHGIAHIVTEKEAGAVVAARADGFDAYYGDAKNATFLTQCGLPHARCLIATVAHQPEVDDIVGSVRGLRPELPIVVRARDAAHARRLYVAGVSEAVPETIEASLQLSEAALLAVGVAAEGASQSVHKKREDLRAALRSAEPKSGSSETSK